MLDFKNNILDVLIISAFVVTKLASVVAKLALVVSILAFTSLSILAT